MLTQTRVEQGQVVTVFMVVYSDTILLIAGKTNLVSCHMLSSSKKGEAKA